MSDFNAADFLAEYTRKLIKAEPMQRSEVLKEYSVKLSITIFNLREGKNQNEKGVGYNATEDVATEEAT